MGVLKPLYFGSDLSDLQKSAKLGDTSKWNAKALCQSSEKVFKEAVIQKDLGDEEKAYVFFYKYIECVQKINKNPEFKKDAKYFTSMYNIQKNSKKAIVTLEALATSLEKRYDEKNEEKNVAEKIAKLDLDLKSSESKDSKLDINSNIDTPIKNGIAKDEPKAYLISHQKLYSLINQKSTTFFILDTRPAADYHNSSMTIPNSLSVPEMSLRPGTTASSIGKNLKVEFRSQWDRRTTVDMLILCDWTSSDFLPDKPVTVLRDAITKWDLGADYKNPPYLLEGGFQKFLYAYPHNVTNPKARAPSEPRIASKPVMPSLDFDYPDLDNGFMTTPSPSPNNKSLAALNSGAIKISREPQPIQPSLNPQYPSLADLNSFTPKSAPRSTYPTTIKQAFNPFTPNIPDRSTKPETSVNSKVLPEIDVSTDDFNEAKQSFDIDRSDSNSSIRSSSGNSQLNHAVVDLSRSSLPKIDRGTKQDAVIKYSGVTGDKLDVLDNMEDVLKTQSDIANKSLAREKEKLDLENKWEFLRLKKEAEHESAMRMMISEEQEKLVDELDRLKIADKERDDVEQRLKDELEAVKKQLKEKDEKEKLYLQNEELRKIEWEKVEDKRKIEKLKEEEIRRKDKERLEMMESVERKRRERREAEKRRKEEERKNSPMRSQQPNGQRDSPARQVQQRRDEERERGGGAGALRHKLRDEDDGRGSSGGGLKRSFSSPNIAQMLEQEDKGQPSAGYTGVPVPKFDRQQKPSLISSRNFAGVWGTQKPGLTGLKNLGNTCYMNSILQCVSNTPPLAHYFISRSYEEDLNTKYSETRGHVAIEFSEVLKNLWSSQFKSISPSDLKQIVGKFKSDFAGRDQQDSHEFVSKLLEWLHSDTNRIVRPSKEPEQNNTDSRDKSAAKKHWRNYLERNQSIIVQLFCGQTRSTVKCFSCSAESVTYREFTNLTLPMPETTSRVNLKNCFEEYLREERLDEFTCDRCKKTGKASKKTDIVKLPPLLVIHLSRFYQEGMYTRKKQNFVNFDLKNLNLGQFAIDGFENKFSQFNLYAVSNHFGSLEGGHYTAYCSSSVLKRWHKYDDQDVSTMDPADVVTPAAYILFYSAIEGQTSLPPLG
eukprot:TRINITY_DN6690_c0_g1_i1.p1 TRINITY_DN6690_c0_g1~~TRINITY_DN6690_c0_g1_i1.p1  ORF type:complete len:1106 (+),score=377.60 TRINITY_DN6690_c0_g1_i1:83-3400(+)